MTQIHLCLLLVIAAASCFAQQPSVLEHVTV